MEPLKFDPQTGLLPAIAQDWLTGEIRMVAWMNRESLEKTLQTGVATFFSRSRNALWVKGETSGNRLRVKRVVADCDADVLLLLVDPAGPSCHTGRRNCFFQSVAANPTSESEPALPWIAELETVIEARTRSTAEKSYTRTLLDRGAETIGSKVREEADELARALTGETDERVLSEAADLVFHVLVGLQARGLGWREVLAKLAERTGQSGHEEKAARKVTPS